MRRIIITPTFRPHFAFNREFLESYRRFAGDASEVGVHFVSTRDEIDDLRTVLAEFPELDVHAHAFEDMLAESGHHDAPLALLREVGKFTYQALKKLYALKALDYDQALVLDSEGLLVKPVHMREVFDRYYADPVVFFSDFEHRGTAWFDGLSNAAVKNAARLLKIPYPKMYFMEYYGWFYDKRLINDLFASFPEDLLPAIRNRLGSDTRIFENQLIYSMLLAHPGRYPYRLQSVNDMLLEHLGPELYDEYMTHFSGGGEQQGVFEMSSRAVNERTLPALRRIYNDQHLDFYRFDLANENADLQRELVDTTPIAFLTSSEGFRKTRERIAVCLSGDARNARQNVRFVKAFLADSDVDVFFHFWDTPARDFLVRALQPKGHVFEASTQAPPPPAFRRIEKNVQPTRPANSTSMYYSIKRANELKRAYEEEHGFRYDVVVRLRLDVFTTRTLQELIEHIRYEQKGWDGILYVPDMAHSVGLNDQIGMGSSDTMDVYAATYDTLPWVAEHDYFNPEYVLLRHVLRSGLRIRTFSFEYVLLRDESASTFDLELHARRTRETWWSAHLPAITPGALDGYFAAKADSVSLIDELNLETPKVFRLRAGARGYVTFDARASRLGFTPDAAAAGLFYVIIPADGDRTAVNVRPRELVLAAQQADGDDGSRAAYNFYPEVDGAVRPDGPGDEDAAFFVGRRGGGLVLEWRPGFWKTPADPRGLVARPPGGWHRAFREEMISGERRQLQPGGYGLAIVPLEAAAETFTLEYVRDPVAEAVRMGLDVVPIARLSSSQEPLPVRLLYFAYAVARIASRDGSGAVKDKAINYIRQIAHIAARQNERGIKGAIKRQIGKRL